MSYTNTMAKLNISKPFIKSTGTNWESPFLRFFCQIFTCEILMVTHSTLTSTLWNIKCSAGATPLVVIHPSHWLPPLVHRDLVIRHLDWNCRLTINPRWTTSNAKRFILWHFLWSVLTIPEPVQPKYSF